MNLACIVSAYKLPDQLTTRREAHDRHLPFLIHVDKKTERGVFRRMTRVGMSVRDIPAHLRELNGIGTCLGRRRHGKRR